MGIIAGSWFVAGVIGNVIIGGIPVTVKFQDSVPGKNYRVVGVA
jgi:hypothetical protein